MGKTKQVLMAAVFVLMLALSLAPMLYASAQEEDPERRAEPVEMAESERTQTTSVQEDGAKEAPTPEAEPTAPDGVEELDGSPEKQMGEKQANATTDGSEPASEADAQKPTASTDPKDDHLAQESLKAQANPQVAYKTHVQTYGWQDWVRDGAMSGTQGESKRLEGINIKLESAPYAGGIEYRTHVKT